MRTAPSAVPLVAALLLAACAPDETAEGNEASAVAAERESDRAAITDAPASPNLSEPAGVDADVGNEAQTPDEAAPVIPARFHGEWSAEPAACGRSHETRLRIDADQLRFHESTGTVEAVKPEGDRTVEVTAAYSGEGQTWTNVRRLTLSEDGDSLTVTGDGSSLTRSRCS